MIKKTKTLHSIERLNKNQLLGFDLELKSWKSLALKPLSKPHAGPVVSDSSCKH